MSHRRSVARVPLELPIAKDMELDTTWSRWFATISEFVYRYDVYEVTVTPTSVAANTTSEQTVTVTGVASNDFVTVNKPSHTTGIGIVNIRVTAANTVAITYMNSTGSAIVPASEKYTFKVEKV